MVGSMTSGSVVLCKWLLRGIGWRVSTIAVAELVSLDDADLVDNIGHWYKGGFEKFVDALAVWVARVEGLGQVRFRL